MNETSCHDFEKAACEPGQRGLLRELAGFVNDTKKWWLVPVLVVLLLLSLVIALSGSAARAVHLHVVLSSDRARRTRQPRSVPIERRQHILIRSRGVHVARSTL